jgi:hypothetical protein
MGDHLQAVKARSLVPTCLNVIVKLLEIYCITSSGFGQITATVSNQREGLDQRTLRLGAKLLF